MTKRREGVNNKGFSLVELIIVIAIMAILAGAIAPAVIRYIRKSRAAKATEEARVIVSAVEAALATKAGEDATLAYDYLYTDEEGVDHNVGMVSNWILSETQSGTIIEESDPNYSNYLIALEVLENLVSSSSSDYKFFNFTGSDSNTIGMECSRFASAYPKCPGVIVAYGSNGKVVMMEYYNYGCLIHYEDNEYIYYDNQDTFISDDRLRQ